MYPRGAMNALALTPVRALSRVERGIYEVDLGAPLNFTTAMRVSGPLTAEVVQAALPAVRARHAALRWRIVRDATQVPCFVEGDALALTVRAVKADSHLAELEWEINTTIDAEQGPLARFVLVDSAAAGTWLLATLHHAIGDAMSGAFMCRDLLQACAQVVDGKTPSLPPLASMGAMDETVPDSAKGLSGLPNHLRFVLDELSMTLRHGRPLRVRRDRSDPVPAYQRKARLIPRVIEPAEGDRLGTRARAEGTTVHGALAAAMILEILADSGRERGSIAFGSPSNVRSKLVPSVGEQVGFYASMLAFRAAVSRDMPFWDLARQVRRQTERSLARGEQLSILRLMAATGGAVLGIGRVEPRALIDRWERSITATTGLTNIGRLAIETVHGPFTVESSYFAVSPSALGDFLATATSVNRRIDWVFTWPDPVMTEAHATALVDGIVARLRAAL
jgi:Condensation domain